MARTSATSASSLPKAQRSRLNSQASEVQCVYLGQIVGGRQVEVETAKVQAIQVFCVLRMRKEVRSFLGLTRYYRKFIPNYSSVASPLTELI